MPKGNPGKQTFWRGCTFAAGASFLQSQSLQSQRSAQSCEFMKPSPLAETSSRRESAQAGQVLQISRFSGYPLCPSDTSAEPLFVGFSFSESGKQR